MRIAARRVMSVAFALALVVGGCVLGGASASAEVIHNFEFSFNGSGSPGGAFEGDLGTVAVDQASGDVYVVEYQRDAVLRFDAAGKYLGEITGTSVPQASFGFLSQASGVAVDNSGGPNNGDLYVAGTQNGLVYRFDSSGKFLSELNGSGTPSGSFTPSGVAVDTAGNLYVADRADGVVDKFAASGAYAGQIASPQIGVNPTTIAVDSSGNVYLTNYNQDVVKLEPGGGASVLDANNPLAVAVDPASGHVYVSETYSQAPARFVEFDPLGTRLGAFGQEQVGAVVGIAVHGATGEVYAADNTNKLVDVFGPGVVIPDATSEAASNVQPTGATLNGTVNPDGLPVSSCQFEYGTSDSYGQTVVCEQSSSSIGSGTSPVPASANVTGLASDTTYHFRLVASNANGTNRGADLTFTTTGPPRVDGESVSSVARTSAMLEAQIDPFGFETDYHFEYGTSSSYGTSVPIPNAAIGSGMGDVAVSQATGALQSGVTYHYRVVAVSAQGTMDGPDQTFTTVPPVYIDGQYATNVASTSATISAKVNPIGTETEYRLEFGTSTSYGQVFAGHTGEVMGDVLISRHLQELQPGTTYHYRLVAQNAFGSVPGEDHTFTTQLVGSGLVLPDGRAWELVSPADKKAAIPVTGALNQASADGDRIVYGSSDSLGGGTSSKQQIDTIMSVRGPDGWRTEDITIPVSLPPEGTAELGGEQPLYELFSSDLSLGVAEQMQEPQSPLSSGATHRTPYLRRNLTCVSVPESCYDPLLTEGDVTPPGTDYWGNSGDSTASVVGGTPDLAHLVIASPYALAPGAVSEVRKNANGVEEGPLNLYEWNGSGPVQLVNVLPSGVPKPNFVSAGLGSQVEEESINVHTVSRDGRRIVWSYGAIEHGDLQLFVRDMSQSRSSRVGGKNANLQGMSDDGARVFYSENGELYAVDVSSGNQTDLTGNHGPSEADAGVQGTVLGLSEDGSYVYFIAKGVLASGAVSGGYNLYVAHGGGSGWTTAFIGTLSGEDEKSWTTPLGPGRESNTTCQAGGCGALISRVSSRVSGNGRYVTFMSSRPLTGYDNTDAVSGKPDEEVFLYDAVANRLVCASCNPSGARPTGVLDELHNLLVDENEKGATWSDHWLAAITPSWNSSVRAFYEDSFYQSRFLSDSGRLFFDSPDGLVPQATNGLMNVFEYEPVGVGGCASGSSTFSPRSGGCVSLLSAGTSSGESMFYDASETGDDVFFITSSRLVGEDYDTEYDVYDAHVCSASAPCHTGVVSPPPCTSGDACKAAPGRQPDIFGPTPSATFKGTGNVIPSTSKGVRRRSLTRAQKLARALRECRKKSGHIRAACERKARRRYGAKQSSRRVAASGKGAR